jgi:anti-anti-sigma regulatory factor
MTDPEAAMSRHPDAGTVLAVPHECLDAAVSAAVEASAVGAVSRGQLVLDLAAVRFADSSGIGLLVRLHDRYPGRVRLANILPPLARCLTRAPADRLPPVIAPHTDPKAGTDVARFGPSAEEHNAAV